MAGCSALPNPCHTPTPDPPTPDENDNSNVVRQFIERVWNYRWTPADDQAFLAARNSGDRCYVPRSIARALDELRSATTIRHRRDQAGRPVQSSGPDDYATCVNAVHEVAQDLKLTILDLVADEDRVVAHIAVEGIDRRLDGRADLPGAFGALPPTGRDFRTHTATFYWVRDGRIAEDWLVFESPHNKARAA
jgi:predicted ester cyclase